MLKAAKKMTTAHDNSPPEHDQLVREELKRYKILAENSSSCIHEISPEGNIVSVNDTGLKLFGYRVEAQIFGKNYLDIVHPDDRDHVKLKMQKALKKETVNFEFRTDPSHTDDTVFSATFIPIPDENGKISRVMSISYDITDLKKTEDLLFDAQKKYRSVIDNIPDTLMELDRSGRILFINRLLKGYSLDEVIGSHVTDFVPDNAKAIIKESLQQVLDTKESQEYEISAPTLEGDIKHWNTRVAPMMQGDVVNRLILISQDITEKRLAEQEREQIKEQLFQSQKLESLGRLAGGVAHEFNNLLSVILLHCGIMWDEVEGDKDAESALNVIVKSAERAEELTRQLLGFARKGKYGAKPIDLNAIIKEAASLLTASVSAQSKVKLTTHLSKKVKPIVGSHSQILQALMNLGINAIDAIAAKGTIHIQSKLCELTEHNKLEPGTYNCVTISDTGHGIEEENLKKIFDPFFTTKDIGKGTGLGLSMTYGILENHGGDIEVESAKGKGATFTLYLPAYEGEPQP